MSDVLSYFDDTDTDAEGLNFTLLYVGVNLIVLVIILLIAAWDTRNGLRKHKNRQGGHVVKQTMNESIELNMDPSNSVIIKNSRNSKNNFLNTDDPRFNQKLEALGNSSEAPTENEEDEEKDKDRSCCSDMGFCCAIFWIDIFTRGFLWTTVLVHIWDTGSDLGVLFTYFEDTDARSLGYLSIAVMINYRVFSSLTLYRAQRGWRDIFLQFCDFQLFVDVYRSTVTRHPTDSLYFIRTMESILESFPQILLSFVYLYDSDDLFVFVSLLGSLISIVLALVHYTDVVFTFPGRPWKALSVFCIRFLFRLCEVLGRAMLLALIWRTWMPWGATVVGSILFVELVFYALLTQMRVPPWELVAFLVANVDLTLTFEGREAALTQPLNKNVLYRLMYKPVSEMFTVIDNEDAAARLIYAPDSLQEERLDYHQASEHVTGEEHQKLLIAPAHYVFRFLEACFQVFCILTYTIVDEQARKDVLGNRRYVLMIAIGCNVATPILYCVVRAFANEHKTLERNLIALVLEHGTKKTQSNLTKEVARLIGAGAKLTQEDYLGNTIVHACARTNNVELLKKLIMSGKAPLTNKNRAGFTPVMECAKYGSLECLQELAKVPGIALNERHHLEESQKKKRGYHGGNGEGLLHMAAMYDHVRVVKWLCNPKANPYFDIHQVYLGNINACHAACVHKCEDALKVLIKRGVDPTAFVADGDGCQHIAAQRGYVTILCDLYAAGVNMNARGHKGHTPLFRAAVHNHASTMKLCIEDFHCDLNVPDLDGKYVGFRCLEMSLFKSLSMLARYDYDFRYGRLAINTEDEDKMTATMWACKYDDVKLLGRLVLAGADVDHVNSLDETAAHYAATFGSLDCLKLLDTAGADLDHGNALLKTPLHKAKEFGRHVCVDFLEKALAGGGAGARARSRSNSKRQKRLDREVEMLASMRS